MSRGQEGEREWRRAPCESGACVEIATLGDTVMMRSSANPGDTPLTMSRDEWREFLAGAKDGIFDDL